MQAVKENDKTEKPVRAIIALIESDVLQQAHEADERIKAGLNPLLPWMPPFIFHSLPRFHCIPFLLSLFLLPSLPPSFFSSTVPLFSSSLPI